MELNANTISDLEKAYGAFPKKLQIEMARAMVRLGQDVNGKIKKQIFALHPGGKGTMSRTWKARPYKTKDGAIAGVEIYNETVYAAIQNYGGTIKPKKKYLAIPLTNAARTSKPRAMGGLVFIESKKGNLLLAKVQKVKKRGKVVQEIKPQYLLRKQTVIKGTGYMEKGIDDSMGLINTVLLGSVALAAQEAINEGVKNV